VSWLSWIVVGFVAGVLAKAVTGQRRRVGCLGTLVVGILGGLLGGALFKAAGDEGINSFSLRSVLVAFVGATALLFVWGAIAGRSES
jgi:uncharacterized membrane protein YeaQ/YmgE (transglycosylase-associated protein family)